MWGLWDASLRGKTSFSGLASMCGLLAPMYTQHMCEWTACDQSMASTTHRTQQGMQVGQLVRPHIKHMLVGKAGK